MSERGIAKATASGIGASAGRMVSQPLLILLGSFVVGGIAIWLLREPWAKHLIWPWFLLLVGMFAGAAALQQLEKRLPGTPIAPNIVEFPEVRRREIGTFLLVLAAGLTFAIVLHLWPDYHADWDGMPALWVAAMVLAILGAWLIGAAGDGASRAASGIRLWADTNRNRLLEILAFGGIFALAIFLRIYRLDAIPPGIYVDETNGALDALYILEGRVVSPFATGWYGTPNGYLYYMAAIVRFLGANWYSLKLVSLLPAILTIPAVYLLARQMFGSLAGLSAMLLMAVSRWHLEMSRWGWNETAPPLFQVLSFYFLYRGLRDRRALDYALCGLLLGLSQYTYLSSRLAVLTLAVFVLYWLLSDPSGLASGFRRSWQGLTIAFVVAVVAAAPILVTYVRDPFAFGNRVTEISVFREVQQQRSYAPLIANISDMLRFFHQAGDWQGKHNLPGEPMTDPFTGLLFAIGVASAIVGWRDQRRLLLLLWLVIGLAGSYLSSHTESPQAYRTLTALPAVVMLAADVLDRTGRAVWRWLRDQGPSRAHPAFASVATGGLVMALLAGAAIWESSVYFGPQASSIAVLRGFNPTENGVAHETIAALQAGETVYLSPGFAAFSPLRFLVYGVYKAKYGTNTLDNPPYNAILPEVSLPIADDGHDVLMLLESTYWPVRGFITSLYPNARMEMDLLSDGSPVYMRVHIPRSDIQSLQGLTQDTAYADGHHITKTVPSIAAYEPDPGVSQVTWSGTLRLEHGGLYAFRTTGGLEVFVGGEPSNGPSYLGRGIYPLRVMTVSGAAGDARLQWKIGEADFTDVPAEALFRLSGEEHGLLATYWSNANWQGPPEFHQVTPFLLLDWGGDQPTVSGGPFSARFTGTLQISEGGAYQFKVEADDGARLTIDGNVLGDGLTAGQPNNFEASTNLASGEHPIEIDYFQQGGGSALRFYWRRSADQDWSPVPPEVLIPAQP